MKVFFYLEDTSAVTQKQMQDGELDINEITPDVFLSTRGNAKVTSLAISCGFLHVHAADVARIDKEVGVLGEQKQTNYFLIGNDAGARYGTPVKLMADSKAHTLR